MHLLPEKFETGSAVAAIIMAMISVTAGASIAKSMFSTLTPENVTVLRLMVSAAILFFAMKAWEVRFNFRSLLVVFAYGATVAGMNLFFYLAIKTVPVGVALAIELIGPLCVATFFSQSRSDYIWGSLAALGIYLLLPASSHMSDLDMTGLFYALVAAFFWGAYILVGKKAAGNFGRKIPALGLIVASLLVLPVGDYTVMLGSLNTEVTLLVVTIALLSSAIPLSLEIFSLRTLRTNTYGVLTSGEPVIGAMVSFIILGEQLTIIQCFGIGAIVAASIGTVLSPYSRRQTLETSQ
ncbi:EamA family transporter [Vibrio sp. SCSIO 43137]|uniref:EamA family transporter n=1 Tax=Vibrio sp. SCSIO 43137 TaxID=3021011 RepID=UPI002307F26C|nr:EamA family transporter [Vibrio sp. SCSIO 43137]WCE31782.1 EamA family transporter [Vibrio sp. SCSIO 43137]